MRIWSLFRKGMREQRRELAILAMTLLAAPFFVWLYWLMLGGGSTTYSVLIIDQTRGGRSPVIEALESMRYADDAAILRIITPRDRTEADRILKNREADALLLIPAGFEASVAAVGGGEAEAAEALLLVGDLTNPRYSVASILIMTAADQYLSQATGRLSPLQLREEALGDSGARSEFELYVPGLLILAVEMIIFQVAMTITAEREPGTLERLRMTPMTAFDYLVGISLGQFLVGAASAALTFLVAGWLGFESHGSLWLALLVALLTTFAMIGVGLIVAAFSRTTTQASVIATFPLFILMFFTGAAFPLPKVPLVNLLPPTHAVNALNKVLTFGAGLGEIAFDLTALATLSALTFGVGVWLFHRMQMGPR